MFSLDGQTNENDDNDDVLADDDIRKITRL